MNRSEDPDDWFGGIDADAPGSLRADRTREDWLVADEGRPGRDWRATLDKRVLVIAAVALVALLAVLAAAGVFSSGHHAAEPPPVTTTTPAPTTPAPTTTTPAATIAIPTAKLKPGDTGAQVRILQRALASLGFSPGKVDGQYGTGTEDAVKQFQRSVGLTDDGVVGPATRNALASAAQKR